MKNNTQKGKEAEEVACDFLRKKGFIILERNFYTRFGELDIIAKKDVVLYFVEVKSGVEFEPVYNLNPTKLQRLQKSVAIYLAKKCINTPFCLSAVILSKNKREESLSIEWLENITLF